MPEKIFEGPLTKKKETAGTVVYAADNYGTIYVPKLLLKQPFPETINVTITK